MTRPREKTREELTAEIEDGKKKSGGSRRQRAARAKQHGPHFRLTFFRTLSVRGGLPRRASPAGLDRAVRAGAASEAAQAAASNLTRSVV